ncbi:MAG TPA: pectate lyase, partial [Ferruginibacter sp.]|nr:pectate lyase [Ferruginibacter sp.]
VFDNKWDPTGAVATTQVSNAVGSDAVAENMLLYQRGNGGWPKHFQGKNVDYKRELNEAERKELSSGYAAGMDATIDNSATTKEIRYLVKTFKRTNEKRFLAAAENGIDYLLKAQYDNGGWPQFYPDHSGYRSEITYNDNAMINVLNVLADVMDGMNDMDVVNAAYVIKCGIAVGRGVNCILKTQVKQNAVLTVWCAQYDAKTLLPAKARAYELPSLSGQESAGILRFLMRFEEPVAEIQAAVKAGVEWFNKVKITGYKYVDVPAPAEASGKDRVLLPDADAVVWARFYDLETNEPFFSGRDGQKKRLLAEVENERRIGYAWYGTWALKLITIEYPAWKLKWKI